MPTVYMEKVDMRIFDFEALVSRHVDRNVSEAAFHIEEIVEVTSIFKSSHRFIFDNSHLGLPNERMSHLLSSSEAHLFFLQLFALNTLPSLPPK